MQLHVFKALHRVWGLLFLLALGCSAPTVDEPGGHSPDSSPIGPSTDATPVPQGPPPVCVFDYDLTLSSHACDDTANRPEMHCRITECGTYTWNAQCLGTAAQAAIAECVRRGAFIGIASAADVDLCWNDKVTPMVTEQQFPTWTESARYASTTSDWSYPAIDDRNNWNCDDCAYSMDQTLSKVNGIKRVMRHYGLDANSVADRNRVIYWDDSPSNLDSVRTRLPEIRVVAVPRHGDSGSDGGCGVTQVEIDAAWR